MQTDILRTINAQGHELNIYGTTEEPLFLAVEVARMIDYSVGRTSEMISRVDEDEKILLNTHGNVEGRKSSKMVPNRRRSIRSPYAVS